MTFGYGISQPAGSHTGGTSSTPGRDPVADAVGRVSNDRLNPAELLDSRSFTTAAALLDPAAPGYDQHIGVLVAEHTTHDPDRFLHPEPAAIGVLTGRDTYRSRQRYRTNRGTESHAVQGGRAQYRADHPRANNTRQ